MNHLELQALRQLFFMTVEECATYISPDNNLATWQQWERGESEIPATIIDTFTKMIKKRKNHINAIIDKINNRIGNNTMRFFPDYASFLAVYAQGDYLEWKIYQSVAAQLYAYDLERLC